LKSNTANPGEQPPDGCRAPTYPAPGGGSPAAARRLRMLSATDADSLNTAAPATSTVAPASATSPAVCGLTPPSTSSSIGQRPRSSSSWRIAAILAVLVGMYF